MDLRQIASQLLPGVSLLWRRRRQKRHSHNAGFLQLPMELLIQIFEQLPPPNQVLLAQSCRALQGIFGGSCSQLSREQHLEYLVALARSMPGRWVCEVCVTLHEVVKLDTPNQPWHMSCLRGWNKWQTDAYGFLNCRVDKRNISIDHRHVQLTLKYTRLQQPRYQTYLQRLLAPYRDVPFSTNMYTPPGLPGMLSVRYSVYPKVAMDASDDLRYLVLSIWSYKQGVDGTSVSLDNMGYLSICPHLRIGPRQPCSWDPPLDRLGIAIAKAFNCGHEVQSMCHRCPTDFSIKATPRQAILQVWQDLGPEDSPTNMIWKAQKYDLREDSGSMNHRLGGITLEHEPGSVRTLYQTGSQDPTVGSGDRLKLQR